MCAASLGRLEAYRSNRNSTEPRCAAQLDESHNLRREAIIADTQVLVMSLAARDWRDPRLAWTRNYVMASANVPSRRYTSSAELRQTASTARSSKAASSTRRSSCTPFASNTQASVLGWSAPTVACCTPQVKNRSPTQVHSERWRQTLAFALLHTTVAHHNMPCHPTLRVVAVPCR